MKKSPPYYVCSYVNFIVIIKNLTKMNQLKIILYILFFSIIVSNCLYGQEKKNSISLSGTVAQYFGIQDFGSPKTEDSYHFPISPGAQLIYWREIFSTVELGLGLNYQNIHHQSQLDTDISGYFGSRKFQYEELSIPLVLKKSFPAKNQNHWYIILGAYNGKQRNIKLQGYSSPGWGLRDYTKVGGYSKDHFFTDLYIDAGYALQLGSLGEISLAPFYKYRINSTWINTYLKKSILGINLNYSFNF